MHTGDDVHRYTAGVDQIDRQPADLLGQGPHRGIVCLGPYEVGLLELQPGDVANLDHRIPRSPWVLALSGAELTV
jgi:hypothetical protein